MSAHTLSALPTKRAITAYGKMSYPAAGKCPLWANEEMSVRLACAMKLKQQSDDDNAILQSAHLSAFICEVNMQECWHI